MNAVHAPIQTSIAFTQDTCGVSAFNPEKIKNKSKKIENLPREDKKGYTIFALKIEVI